MSLVYDVNFDNASFVPLYYERSYRTYMTKQSNAADTLDNIQLIFILVNQLLSLSFNVINCQTLFKGGARENMINKTNIC